MEHQDEADFFTILNGGHIRAVYQPIVSLENGSVFGYEALSRILHPGCRTDIGQMFKLAAQEGKLWEFEKLCRTKALMHAKAKPVPAKLFLNVDPNTINDRKFRTGFTCEMLKRYGLNPDDIIFEVTERSCIDEMEAFQEIIEHYRDQDFKIAVDDFGSGYSGLSRVCSFFPNFIKIDMALIRNIHADSVKKSAVGSIVKLCQESGIASIAEGIETEAELKTLIRLGVEYGQGYLLAKPDENFCEIDLEKKLLIKSIRNKIDTAAYQPSFFGSVRSICKPRAAVRPDAKAVDVYQQMEKSECMGEVAIVDENGIIRGVLTRRALLEKFSGRYGFTLNYKKTAIELAKEEYLVVCGQKNIDEVADLAMNRNALSIYDAIFVTDNDKYWGVVTVKDLLQAAIQIQIKRASEASPLTGLPGNTAVQAAIASVLQSDEQHTIIYLDLDNFKAYNDAYSFTNGDKMIKIVADTRRECCHEDDFLGHIGGDDFVIITQEKQVKQLCNRIISIFSKAIQSLYHPADWARGCIVSTNRNGFVEQFPVATLSIAAVTNMPCSLENIEMISRKIAQAKKKSKQISGNAVVMA